MTLFATDISEKDTYNFVEFVYGDIVNAPQYARYTDWGQNSGAFVSQLDVDISLPENSGSFGEAECKIELPNDAFTSLICATRQAPCYVKVTEVTKPLTGGPSGLNLVVFRGRLMRSVRNYQGRRDSCMLKFAPIKARLDVQLGLAAEAQCEWTLFGPGCSLSGLLRAGFQHGGEILSISGKVITLKTPNTQITAPTSPGGNTDRYWEKGYIERDGLQIGIFQWKLVDPTHFTLRSKPPPSWIGAGSNSVLFVPGCHKIIDDCRDVWDNESQWLGFGAGIPIYNPLFEDPA